MPKVWNIGNTTVRNPKRIENALKVVRKEGLSGNLSTKNQQSILIDKLSENNILEYGLITKEDKELKAKMIEKNKGKIALDEQEDNIIRGIHTNFMKSEKVKKWTNGKVEVSHYGTYQGIDVRVRPDCLGDDWISDIKTCQDASPEKFNKDIQNRNYHIQAYFYCFMLGIDPSRFRFIACETNPPFAVEVYKLDDVYIENAKEDFERAFTFWKLYKEKGIITGYQSQDFDDDGTIILKGWRKRK